MRPLYLLCSFLLLSTAIFAQSPWGTNTTGPISYNNGNVGIGTASPGVPLDVHGVINTTSGMYIHTDGSVSPNLAAYIFGPSNGNANVLMQGRNGNDAAFWISSGNGLLQLGASGGSAPAIQPLNIDYVGHVGINCTDTKGYQFAVAGSAIFIQAVVKLQANWPDYVFSSKYQLPSLQNLDSYIKTNRHLPGMPTAGEVENNVLDLGANQAKLLEKIEELTLYTIELQKQVDELKKKVSQSQQ
jgi:hypothetical protein